MKNNVKIIVCLTCIGALGMFVYSFKTIKQSEQKRTEEYAMMWTVEVGSKIGITTVIGNNYPTYEQKDVYSKEKAKNPNTEGMDYTYITNKMHELNAQGFELVATTWDAGRLRMQYTFKRDLN